MADHVRIDVTPEELADRLALSGTAVEAVHLRGIPREDDNLQAFRVGRVVSVEPHPDADRLRVCQVDLGGPNGPSQIVCGASNVAAGQLVAVALPGAVMPGGRRLEVAKLRGVESNGMICSEVELELGDEADGIMVLENGAQPGAPLVETMPAVSEAILELELTSNRADCMSIAGMAREVAAVLDTEFHPPDHHPAEATGTTPVEALVGLRVDDTDLCLRYTARAFEDVRVGPSPAWLRHRLEAAGMRSISNVVDITNYVMLLTGQPLHAFDLDRLAGPEIIVRRAVEGERLVTLDDVDRRLDPSMLAICDADGPVAVAGVMGAEAPEVSEATTRVLLEAATFDGPSVLSTSLSLGLRTESSARFEKGLPVELAAIGSAMAANKVLVF
jgi:phenylalanyl-tRNA synthetase beta chain